MKEQLSAEFISFIDRLAKVSGEHAVCESVKSAFRTMTESGNGSSTLTWYSIEEAEEVPEILEWVEDFMNDREKEEGDYYGALVDTFEGDPDMLKVGDATVYFFANEKDRWGYYLNADGGVSDEKIKQLLSDFYRPMSDNWDAPKPNTWDSFYNADIAIAYRGGSGYVYGINVWAPKDGTVLTEGRLGRALGAAAIGAASLFGPMSGNAHAAQNAKEGTVQVAQPEFPKRIVKRYSIGAEPITTKTVLDMSNKIKNAIKDEYLASDMDNSRPMESWGDAEVVYDTLMGYDTKLASLFARNINAELHNKLKITPQLGR